MSTASLSSAIAAEIRRQQIPCPDHPWPLPKPSCWTCARNGAFERAARIAEGSWACRFFTKAADGGLMTGEMTLADLNQLTSAGYDVVMGTRKGPGATGFYVALEHLSLDEPKEFYAYTLADTLRQACLWSTASIQNRQEDR